MFASVGDVSVGPLSAIPEVLRQHGVVAADVLGTLALPPELFSDDGNRISLRDVGLLLQHCTDLTQLPHFALLVGQAFNLSRMGVLGYLVRNQPTVEAALRELVLHLHLQDRGAAMELETSGRRARISYSVATPNVPATGLIHALVAMLGCRVLKELCGPQWHPAEVLISQRRPAESNPYRMLFGCPVRFEEPLTTVVFDARWLTCGVSGADPRLLSALRGIIDLLDGAMNIGTTDRVRRVLRNRVMAGSASANAVARTLSMSPRTMRRQLEAEGMTFHELVAEARLLVAQQLLEHTSMAVADIAGALHYADSSGLSRAFFKWVGSKPSAWRKLQQRSGQQRRAHLAPIADF